MNTDPLFINESEVIRRIEEVEAVKTSVLNGTATVNEARASLGLDAIDGGEQAVGLKPFPIITPPLPPPAAKIRAERQASLSLPAGWRWLEVGERAVVGDVVYDYRGEPMLIDSGTSWMITEQHHPVARFVRNIAPPATEVPLLNLGGKRAIDLDD